MANPPLNTICLVLKKTKLNESDLIITLLFKNGSQIRAVAKGARKPMSAFSTRLELFNICNLLLAEGKNLYIVREARLLLTFNHINQDVEKFTCASCALELLEKTTQKQLSCPQLFPMTVSFLKSLDSLKNGYYFMAYAIAFIMKVSSYLGFRPSFTKCIMCSADLSFDKVSDNTKIAFSYEDGGVICYRCNNDVNCDRVSAEAICLLHVLLHRKFDEISMISTTKNAMITALKFCNIWTVLHLNANLKSLKLYLKEKA